MMRKRKGFTALLEFMTSLLIVSIGAAAVPLVLAVNKENYANQLISSLEMISSKTRLSQNALDANGLGNIIQTARDRAASDYPGMTLNCVSANVTGASSTCTISYEILGFYKTKTVHFSDSYIDGGRLLGN